MGILHIVVDGFLNLLLAFWSIYSLCSSLADIACSIELRALPTQPKLVERYTLSLKGGDADILWNDSVTATNTRKASRLGIRTELDGALACTTNLVDGTGYLRVLNLRLLGGII